MAGVNNWTITGNLTRDPELRSLADGKEVCNLGVAVNGFKEGKVLFVDVSVWGKGAQPCATYLTKGSAVGVTGSCELRTWERQDGTTGFAVTIPDGRVTFLGSKQGSGGGQGQTATTTPPAQPAAQNGASAAPPDDIPF
jgi:single-strand DNA-binding protein